MPENDSTKGEDNDRNDANSRQKENVTGDERKKKNADSWFCADPGCKKRNLKSVDNCQLCGMSAKMSKSFQQRRGGGQGRGGGRGVKKGTWGCWNRNRMDRKKKAEMIDYEDPVQNMFSQISNALDYRHDKKERIVKLSRDIAIESKRVIFCLHRIKSEEDKDTVLGEAEHKLADIKLKLWYYMARELKGEDHYQFSKAYCDGLQEWVEAFSFYNYLAHGKLVSFDKVEKELVFKDRKSKNRKADANHDGTTEGALGKEGTELSVEDKAKVNGFKDKDAIEDSNAVDEIDKFQRSNIELISDTADHVQSNEVDTTSGIVIKLTNDDLDSEELTTEQRSNMISVTVPRLGFILGLADLSGELMRNAINFLGSGNHDVCFTLLDFLQNMIDGFTRLPKYEAPKNIGQKMLSLKQSCEKVENACYAICVRGSEIPKKHLADLFNQRVDKGENVEDDVEEFIGFE